MCGLFAVEVGVLFEMLDVFLLLRFGKVRFFAGVAKSGQLIVAAVIIFFPPKTNGCFVDEKCFGHLRNAPTAAKQDNRLDAIRDFTVTLSSVQRLQRCDLLACQVKVVHTKILFGLQRKQFTIFQPLRQREFLNSSSIHLVPQYFSQISDMCLSKHSHLIPEIEDEN